jgi:hypothetical protein
MGNQANSSIAALVVLTFIALALAACASSERLSQAEPIPMEEHQAASAVPEFHGAAIGADTLRSRLDSE